MGLAEIRASSLAIASEVSSRKLARRGVQVTDVRAGEAAFTPQFYPLTIFPSMLLLFLVLIMDAYQHSIL
ncbi:MAG: hypothetical protein CVT77_03480 [Alphaproteobacteria bacterium HGW-Alphaproteobacteria-16]|nr:MAG: hypothetical protein CVT77_03480 [Alphaproteobacteria bacterium HGW-Alphaproteobacteria-16]